MTPAVVPSPLAWLAIANGWGQLSLAEASGVPQDTMRRLWHGRNRPSTHTADRLAGPLGVDAADVVDPHSWLTRHGLSAAAGSAPAAQPETPAPRSAAASLGSGGPAARVARAYATPATAEPGWRQRAKCLEVDPELFWPEPGAGGDAALAVCAGCPVVGDCREAFLTQPRDEGGVWFATTHLERQARAAQRRGVAA